jgi:hypothetical protein
VTGIHELEQHRDASVPLDRVAQTEVLADHVARLRGRLASIEVLRHMRIEGRQAMPTGAVLDECPFETNIAAHLQVLANPMMKEHARGVARGRHVNWVIEMLRSASSE